MTNSQSNSKVVVFRSTYSLLKSALKIEDALKFAAKEGVTDIVLIDRGTLAGVIPFYRQAISHKIRPHIGVEIQVEDLHILCIAKNNVGYQSLIQLSSVYNKKNINAADIMSLLHEMIVIFYDATDEQISIIKQKQTVDCYAQHGTNADKISENHLLSKINLPVANYGETTDKRLLELLTAIDENKEMTNILFREQTNQLRVHIEGVPIILTRDTFNIQFDQHHLPSYSSDKEHNIKLFKTLCEKGLKKRYGAQLTEKEYDRMLFEMEVIEQMGFVDYFLIIWDVMRFARQEDIVIGPGRGSAVGSIVAYILGITMIDPIKYNLLFERFFNQARVSLPDIDIDIEDTRRSEIVAYLRDKYGEHHVTHIGTFGTFGAKSSIRDVAKAYAFDAKKTTNLLKQIQDSTKSIAYNIENNKQLQLIQEQQPDIAQILQVSQKIEGMPRHTSVHAAGVILTDEPVTQYVATQELEPHIYVTQPSMGACEAIGLLKIDFLGLRNLSIIRKIAETVAPTSSVVEFISKIPKDDIETFQVLTSGETTGIFQFESKGMRRVLQNFKITEFMDIATVLALYRPGPMQFIDEYIQRKNNGKKFEVRISAAREILKDTYGIMVYQEQVMQLAQEIGGMSLAEADLFRRAIGKKDGTLLQKQKVDFINGAIKKGIPDEDATQLFEEILSFANYGFNKSHALAYAQISYEMAYLKANYTAIFMTELINSVINNEKKVQEYLNEAGRFNIKILPPDVTKSDAYFTVENEGAIRMGLLAIKGLGRVAVQEIIDRRSEKAFHGIGDFLSRVKLKAVNSQNLKQLANGYAFSIFSKNQKAVHQFLEIHEQGRKFQGVEINNTIKNDVDDYTLVERRNFEQEAFGFSLFAHPLLGYPKNKVSLRDLPMRTSKMIVIIDRVKEITTRQGKKMAFITISDLNEQVEAVVFPEVYQQYSTFVLENKIVEVVVRGQRKANGELTRNVLKISPYFLEKK